MKAIKHVFRFFFILGLFFLFSPNILQGAPPLPPQTKGSAVIERQRPPQPGAQPQSRPKPGTVRKSNFPTASEARAIAVAGKLKTMTSNIQHQSKRIARINAKARLGSISTNEKNRAVALAEKNVQIAERMLEMVENKDFVEHTPAPDIAKLRQSYQEIIKQNKEVGNELRGLQP